MEDCVFCKIMAGEIPSKKMYEDDMVYAIADIAPQAPVHILVFPKKHIESVAAVEPQDSIAVGQMVIAAQCIARGLGIEDGGYRLVMNTNGHACQSVRHLHMHILGGRQLSGQMG